MAVIDTSGRLAAPSNVCKVMMDVLEALDYAHEFTDKDGNPYNLVHRDVSPHNVLISNDGIVKLCDFGVAKAVANQTKTQPGAVKGKFAYMAPEQIQNAHAVDRRADVFAAGIMFYELLTGERPFTEADRNRMSLGMPVEPPSVRAVNPAVPASVEAVIQQALAFDPVDLVSLCANSLACRVPAVDGSRCGAPGPAARGWRRRRRSERRGHRPPGQSRS